MLGQAESLKVSICIPTYNRRDILVQTLGSLEHQSVGPDRYEVIVTDDGSSDDTVAVVSAMKPRHALRIIQQENAGPAAASNTAARHASHDVLIFLDDDQIVSPSLVEAHLATQARHGGALVQGFYPVTDDSKRRGSAMLYDYYMMAAVAPTDVAHPVSSHIWSANISVPRVAWERVGGFDEGFRKYGSEDTDFGIRVAELGLPVIFDPAAHSRHIHVVGYGSLRRQSFQGGRSLVRLAEKFNTSVEEVAGNRFDRRTDRLFSAVWAAPVAAHATGGMLTGMLFVADGVRARRAQLAMARLIHRFYKVGGIRIESSALGNVPGGVSDRGRNLDHAGGDDGAGFEGTNADGASD
jgi:GT2 family glycosyltransferase